MPEWRWLWCAEHEAFPSAVLAKRFGHPNLGDITAPDFVERAIATGIPDVIIAGTPCQAFSIAGSRGGLTDDRGNLTLIFTRIIHDIAVAARHAGRRSPVVLWENVPGVLSDDTNAFGCFLGEVVGADDALQPPRDESWPCAGMVSGPRARIAWRILDAQHFKLAQRRERVFAVIDLGDGPDPAAVLFERKGLPGNYTPRVQTREKPTSGIAGAIGRGTLWRQVAAAFADPRFGVQEKAGTLGGASQSGGFGTTDLDNNGAFIPEVAWAMKQSGRIDLPVYDIVGTLSDGAHMGGGLNGQDAYTGRILPVAFKASHFTRGKDGSPQDVAPPLAVEDDRGDQSPLVLTPVCFDTTQLTSPGNFSRPRPGDPAHPLSATAHPPAIAINLRGREGGINVELADKASIRAADGGSSRSYVAFHGTQDPDVSGDLSPPLGTNHGQECALAFGWAIRRLTPNECARLQGFPDDQTRIEWRGKPASQCPDGPQYKGYGNSMAVPVIRWICKRIEFSMRGEGNG